MNTKQKETLKKLETAFSNVMNKKAYKEAKALENNSFINDIVSCLGKSSIDMIDGGADREDIIHVLIFSTISLFMELIESGVKIEEIRYLTIK